jgi:hypothetical protein
MKTHILCSTTVFWKPYRLWDNVEKYFRPGQATYHKTVHGCWMLGTQGYKHTIRICNTYCFSTATTVARTHLIVTLRAHSYVLRADRVSLCSNLQRRTKNQFWSIIENNVIFGYGVLNTVQNEPRSSVLPYTQKSATSKKNCFRFW